MHEFTPEVLYADTVAKKTAYGELSRAYAEREDAYIAVHAAFAADIQAVQAVMWERVMVASPNPDEQFRAIGETVSQALTAYATAPAQSDTARESVEQARAGLAAAFDPAAVAILEQAYLPLDHLNTLPAPDPTAGERIAQSRTKGMDPVVVAARRRKAATDRMAAAFAANNSGDLDEAMRQAWQADWAAYESYLLDAAVQIGDSTLVTVEMRWALATQSMGNLGALPSEFVEAVTTIRRHLLASLGTIEGQRLAERFEPLS